MFKSLSNRLSSFKYKSLINKVKPGMVIVEVGAGKGEITTLLVQKVGLIGQVHVFEPDLNWFNHLQSNFISGRFPQIILQNKALLQKNGPQTLDYNNENYSNTLNSFIKHYIKIGFNYTKEIFSKNRILILSRSIIVKQRLSFLKYNKAPEENKSGSSDLYMFDNQLNDQLVNCTTLDDYSKATLLNLDLILFNVNGYAAQVLLGAFTTIRTFRPVIIIIFSEESLRQKGFSSHFLLQWLKALGYTPFEGTDCSTFEMIESKAETDPQWCFEIIFRPENALLKFSSIRPGISLKQVEVKTSSPDLKSIRYLYAYPALNSEIQSSTEKRIERIRSRGYNIQGFCLPLKPPGPLLIWPELDKLWRQRDTELLNKYEQLFKITEGIDVLINYGGANLHPEFVRQLSTFNVFTCHDDPEASEYLSHYVAPAYDFSFVGNAGCIDMYNGWGIQNVDFLPLGVNDSDRDLTITKESILNGQRDVPIVFLASRDKHRDLMVEPLLKVFPSTIVFGNGWPNSFLPNNQQIALYGKTLIGWNMDQSVGPATSRTFKLPANGVLLIGNNRAHLGKLFELDVEAIGFDTTKECIDYTRYYLSHDRERREIAARGWSQTINNYTEDKIWQKMLQIIKPFIR